MIPNATWHTKCTSRSARVWAGVRVETNRRENKPCSLKLQTFSIEGYASHCMRPLYAVRSHSHFSISVYFSVESNSIYVYMRWVRPFYYGFETGSPKSYCTRSACPQNRMNEASVRSASCSESRRSYSENRSTFCCHLLPASESYNQHAKTGV